MQIKPILAALRRHKAGTILIALQIALTLAIVCNALFIIQQRLSRLQRPTGVAEAGLFAIENHWADKSSLQHIDAQMQADLIALRRLSSVQDATAVNSYPLRGSGWSADATMTPEQDRPSASVSRYFVDDHTLSTFGVRLIAGRNFRTDEIGSQPAHTSVQPPVVIITKDLAAQLFPNQSPLGKRIHVAMHGTIPSTVVGVTDTLQSHTPRSWSTNTGYNAVLIPARLPAESSTYLIRAKPGQLALAMRDAPQSLFAQSRMRIIDPKDGVLTFAQVRSRAYESDRGMAILMGIICVVLLAITAAGIVGLTSFWVGQRRRQIGVRRALGATRNDIVGYFLTENLLISVGGVVVGTMLALGINLWMMVRFEMARLSLVFVLDGVIALLVLGQLASLAPALRASRVSPVEATRAT